MPANKIPTPKLPLDFTSRPLSPLASAIRLSLLGVGMGLVASTAQAATVVVTSNTDNSAMCTLREALLSISIGGETSGCVNGSSEPFGTNDTIIFSLGGTISLSAGQLIIGNDVIINASSVSGVTIDANQNSRVFSAPGGFSVGLSNLTIQGGSSSGDGGGIYAGAESSLTIENSVITGNSSARYGGGIYIGASSKLTVTDSQLTNNATDQDGGAIYSVYTDSSLSSSTITLTNTTISGNTTSGDEGGGIWSYGYGHLVQLTNTNIINNQAATRGGGIYLGGQNSSLSIVGGSVSSNIGGENGGGIFSSGNNTKINVSGTSINSNVSGSSYSGGGMYLVGDTISATLTNTNVSGNTVGLHGGGIYLNATSLGSLVLDRSTISSNTADLSNGGGYGGGIFAVSVSLQVTRSRILDNRNGFYGGGIYGYASTIAIDRSTIAGNSSIGDGGGIYATSSSLTLTNSTVSNNSAGTSTNHEGGGIWSSGGYLDIANSTISGNSTYGEGGGIYAASPATLRNVTVSDNTAGVGVGGFSGSSSLSLINSIIANSTSLDCDASNVVSDAQSIIEDGSCASSARSGDPGLLALASNGGPTQTHALRGNSIAVNTGDNTTCLVLDQRGVARSDGKCDVGAFESDDSGFIVIPLANGKAVVVPQ